MNASIIVFVSTAIFYAIVRRAININTVTISIKNTVDDFVIRGVNTQPDAILAIVVNATICYAVIPRRVKINTCLVIIKRNRIGYCIIA